MGIFRGRLDRTRLPRRVAMDRRYLSVATDVRFRCRRGGSRRRFLHRNRWIWSNSWGKGQAPRSRPSNPLSSTATGISVGQTDSFYLGFLERCQLLLTTIPLWFARLCCRFDWCRCCTEGPEEEGGGSRIKEIVEDGCRGAACDSPERP